MKVDEIAHYQPQSPQGLQELHDLIAKAQAGMGVPPIELLMAKVEAATEAVHGPYPPVPEGLAPVQAEQPSIKE